MANQKNHLNFWINLKTLLLSNGLVLVKKMKVRTNGLQNITRTGRKVKEAIISLTQEIEVTNRYLKISMTIILHFSLVLLLYHIMQCLNPKEHSQDLEGHRQKYISKRLLLLHLTQSPMINDRKDLKVAILQSLNVNQSNQIHQ